MRVKKLTLKNFRNYKEQTIEFSPSTNIILGNNANGKTNILEAVYLFAHGKSHRAKQDFEMINFDSKTADVTLEFETAQREYSAVIKLSKAGKKLVTVNNVPITKLSRLMSYMKVVMFSPDDLSLIKGAPSLRRRFIDAAVCRIYPSYMASLSEYQKAAVEKNNLLKTLKKSGVTSDAYLSVWNDRLAESAEKIMHMRSEFTEELSKLFSNVGNDISGEVLTVSYEPNLPVCTKDEIFDFLEKNQKSEIFAASMRHGIQRDDIFAAIGGLDARVYASQGQQRTCALALKIAEADYVYEKTGEYPVLLLDDILSELDINRRMYLWERIVGKQVLITCTDMDFFENKHGSKLFYVSNNTIEDRGIDDVSSSGK